MLIDGQRIRQSTDTRDRKLAEKIHAKIYSSIIEGKYYPKPLGSNKLFCEMMEKFIKKHETNLSQNSKKAYASSLKHLLPVFENMPLSKITLEKITDYQEDRLEKGAAPATIGLEIALLSKAFKTAQKWKWIDNNPCFGIDRPKINNKRVRYLKEDEVERLYSSLPEWLLPIVVIARFTGLRLSNILELTWDNVNLFSKTLIVGKTKNGEPLGLPMTETAFETFKSISKIRRLDTSLVFYNSKGKIFDMRYVSATFRQCRIRANIKDFRFHDLRHDFCSKLVQRGVDLYVVAALAGHRDIKTTQRYAHLSPEKLRKDIAVLDTPMTQNSHKGENAGFK